MKNYIDYIHLSKKERKRQDRKMRKTFAGINPVTKVKENKKAYSRKRAADIRLDDMDGFFI